MPGFWVSDPVRAQSYESAVDRRKVSAVGSSPHRVYPYLASALFAADIRSSASTRTIAINQGWQIHADPAELDAMAVDDLGRLLVHLVSHVLREHGARADRLDVRGTDGGPEAWNRGSDAEVNDDLALDGMVPPCAADLPADLGAEAGRMAEHYYEPAQTGGRRRWDCGSGCDGVERPWDGDTDDQDGLKGRDQEFVRLGVAAEMQRCQGLEPGTVPPAGFVGPNNSSRLAQTGAVSSPQRCRRVSRAPEAWWTTRTAGRHGVRSRRHRSSCRHSIVPFLTWRSFVIRRVDDGRPPGSSALRSRSSSATSRTSRNTGEGAHV